MATSQPAALVLCVALSLLTGALGIRETDDVQDAAEVLEHDGQAAQQWVLGDAGESCDTVCDNRGGLCTPTSLEEQSNLEPGDFAAKLQEWGESAACSRGASTSRRDIAPYVNKNDVCWATGRKNSTCEGVHKDGGKRFCFCEVKQASPPQVLSFKGPMGLRIGSVSGEVEALKPGGQAEKLGVEVGWWIHRVDDRYQYTAHRIQGLVGSGEEYNIAFAKEKTPFGYCLGDVAWKDALGRSCDDYTASNFCGHGGFPSQSFKDSDSCEGGDGCDFEDFSVSGVSARDACCDCGGGVLAPAPTTSKAATSATTTTLSTRPRLQTTLAATPAPGPAPEPTPEPAPTDEPTSEPTPDPTPEVTRGPAIPDPDDEVGGRNPFAHVSPLLLGLGGAGLVLVVCLCGKWIQTRRRSHEVII